VSHTVTSGRAFRPRLRDSVIVVQLVDGRLQFRATHERVVSTFDVDPWVVELVPLLDGTRTTRQLAEELSLGHGDRRLHDVLELMRRERFLSVGSPPGDRTTRHSRQMLLFDEMIAAGEVDGSAGLPDARALQARLTRARVVVETWRAHVEEADDLRTILREGDLVVSCADQPSVAHVSDVVAEASQAAGSTHIVGGAYGALLGAPGVSVIPGRTTCWLCIREATADDHGRAARVLKGSVPGGVVAPLAGIVGSLTAMEVLRLLLGLPPTLAGGIREIDLATHDSVWRAVPPRPECGCVSTPVTSACPTSWATR